MFASARLGTNRMRTTVGPISIVVDEPMSRLGLVVDHEEIAIDAVFAATTPPVEEPRFVNHELALGPFDYTRYTQFGAWSGTASVDGDRVDLTGMVGCRDRSWGQRGGASPTAARW